MKYPKIKQYIRFYRYADELKLVVVENPIENRCASIYVNNPDTGMGYVGYKQIGSYLSKFDDWAQVDKVPKHIPNSQHFDWYFQSWENNK